jgi:signal transduction histidine kinase
MFRISSVRSWPLSWKVPLLAAGFMIAIATTISQVVLSRLASDQESNLRALTNAYLDGISAAVIQPVMRGDVWETFDALDRARTHYAGVAARYVIVELPDKRILAASEPLRFPVRSSIPEEISRHFPVNDGLDLDKENGRAWLSRSLKVEGHSVGKILAEIDIAALVEVRRRVMWTLILMNGAMTFAFTTIGYVLLRRMLGPLGTLTRYVERVREGRAESIPEGDHYRISAEFRGLFDRFNAMARALNDREALTAQLAAQEKFAVLGKLASVMAHEVNNPLGGLFNALDTLRRHGADPNVRDSTVSLLHRGLAQIHKVVRSTLVTYRPESFTYGLAPADMDDLRILVEPEALHKNLILQWRNEVLEKLPVAVGSVRQAILNLLLNACAASPPGGKVNFLAKVENEELVVEVGDTGPGLPSPLAAYLMGEGDAATLPGNGLGLWIVRRLVGNERGTITVSSVATQGTTIRIAWPFRKDRADGPQLAIEEELVRVG